MTWSPYDAARPRARAGSALLSSLVAVALASGGCDAGSDGGPETWRADLTGTNAPGHCPIGGDKGEFAELHTVTLTFPGSIVSALRDESTLVGGSGTFSGAETVSRQSEAPSICRLEATQVTNVAVEVTYVGILATGGPTFRYGAPDEAPLIIDRYFNPTVGNRDCPISSIEMNATAIADTSIAGTWRVNAGCSSSGNSAHGDFLMTRGGVGPGPGADAGVDAPASCTSTQTPLGSTTCEAADVCPTRSCRFTCDGTTCTCRMNDLVINTAPQGTTCATPQAFNAAKATCPCFP